MLDEGVRSGHARENVATNRAGGNVCRPPKVDNAALKVLACGSTKACLQQPAQPTASFPGGNPHAQGRRHRPRHHQLGRLGPRGGRARRDPQRRGIPHHSVRRRFLQDRRGARRRGGEAPGDHQPRPHRSLGEAPHGHELVDRHRREELQRPGDVGAHPPEAEARRRVVPRRHGHAGRRHRARVLRRRRAPGHQGGRRDRGPRGAAHHQRAHGRRARLRTRQGQRPDHPRVRPRRRHLRRVDPRPRRGRVRGEVDRRQHPPRRRRLGPARHRLARVGVQERARRRPLGRQDGRAATQGSRGEGQGRALARCRRPR